VGADPLIESFLEMMTAERGASRNTTESYARDLADFLAFARKRKTTFETLDKKSLETYVQTLNQNGFAPSTVARKLSSLRQFFHFLYTENIRRDDPSAALDAPKQTRSLPKSLNEADITQLIECARAQEDVRLVAMLELLYASGLRVSELVTLPMVALQRLEGQEQPFLIVRGKGNKERIVPLHKGAVEAMQAYIAQRSEPSVWLFPSHGKGGCLTRQRFGQMLKDLAIKAGLDPEKISPHALRHSFASHLLAGGADLRVIQELLGHADISTTQIYTHIEQDKLTKLVTQHHPLAKKGK